MRSKTAAESPHAEPVALDRPGMPAELLFLAIVLILSLFFSLAGIPGEPTPVAGEGSEKLRKGWLEQAGLRVEGSTESGASGEAAARSGTTRTIAAPAGADGGATDVDGGTPADRRTGSRRQDGR